MDHEWFTEQLAPDQVGWDWFSVQLDNRTELMLFELRRKDGSIDPYSSGTFIDASGVARHLRHEDFSLEPLSRWEKYPVEWRLRVPSLNIDITCHPVLRNQKLRALLGRRGGLFGKPDRRRVSGNDRLRRAGQVLRIPGGGRARATPPPEFASIS